MIFWYDLDPCHNISKKKKKKEAINMEQYLTKQCDIKMISL